MCMYNSGVKRLQIWEKIPQQIKKKLYVIKVHNQVKFCIVFMYRPSSERLARVFDEHDRIAWKLRLLWVYTSHANIDLRFDQARLV